MIRHAAVGVVQKFAFVLLLVGVLLAADGCAPGGPLRFHLHDDVQRPPRSVVLFICDGLYVPLVEEGCRAGWLPNIQQRFVERGTSVENAMSPVPPITYAAITTILTGVDPQQHDIWGNHWFDPHDCLFRDYATVAHYCDVNNDASAALVYELMRPAASASIQAPQTRGLTKNVANWMTSGISWFFRIPNSLDAFEASSVDEIAAWSNQARLWPSLLTIYFPGVDKVAHDDGRDAREYYDAVRNFDHQVGRVCDWLEREKLLDSTLLILTSDHGQVRSDPDGHYDLKGYVRRVWGRHVTTEMRQDGTYDERQRYFSRFDTILAPNSGRRAVVWLRGAGGWGCEPSHTEIEQTLLAAPAGQRPWDLAPVEMVLYPQSPQRVVLRSSEGYAIVQERTTPAGPEYAYSPVTHDILRYTGDPRLREFVAAGFHSSRQWLDATAGQLYPDLVPNLTAIFRSPRGGNIWIMAKRGVTFSRKTSEHGGFLRDERRVPLMLAGPGIPAGGRIPAARLADIVPTLLDWLRITPVPDAQFDGIDLLKTAPSGR